MHFLVDMQHGGPCKICRTGHSGSNIFYLLHLNMETQYITYIIQLLRLLTSKNALSSTFFGAAPGTGGGNPGATLMTSAKSERKEITLRN